MQHDIQEQKTTQTKKPRHNTHCTAHTAHSNTAKRQTEWQVASPLCTAPLFTAQHTTAPNNMSQNSTAPCKQHSGRTAPYKTKLQDATRRSTESRAGAYPTVAQTKAKQQAKYKPYSTAQRKTTIKGAAQHTAAHNITAQHSTAHYKSNTTTTRCNTPNQHTVPKATTHQPTTPQDGTAQAVSPCAARVPLLTAPRQCGSALQAFHCPLSGGSKAVHCRSSTAHSPRAGRLSIAGVALPTAPR